MSFFEVQFPTNISIGAAGGPEFSTHIVAIDSGYEQRNQRWETCRLRYDVSHGVRTIDEMKQLVAFFRMVKGRAHGFRFKDYTDYTVIGSEGIFAKNLPDTEPSLYATGERVYQLFKTYGFESNYTNRLIKKPNIDTFKVFADGVERTDYTLDPTTGILTWEDTAGTQVTPNTFSFSVSGITLGAVTTIINTAVTHTINVGDRIYLSGIVGTTQLNNLYYTVTAVGANTISIALNSSTFSAYISGGTVSRHAITSETTSTVHWDSHGLVNGDYIYFVNTSGGWSLSKRDIAYQVSDVSINRFKIVMDASAEPKGHNYVVFIKFFTSSTQLTWTGEFDVPCRFDTDYMNSVAQSSIHGSWESIPIIEIRQ